MKGEECGERILGHRSGDANARTGNIPDYNRFYTREAKEKKHWIKKDDEGKGW